MFGSQCDVTVALRTHYLIMSSQRESHTLISSSYLSPSKGCPTDRAMVLAQIRRQGFATVIRETGLKGLYLGWTATLYRDMAFNSTFFALREGGVKLWTLNHEGQPPSIMPRHVIGLCAGMVAATISCPFDVLKTRMQGRQLG